VTVIIGAGVSAVSYCEFTTLWNDNECKRAIARRKQVGRERIERTRRRCAGSKAIVNEPVLGATGLPLGGKPDAVKLSVSVIVAALAVFMAPALSATAQIAVNKA
jgi:hypothetical protein